MTSFALPAPLVTTTWLQQHLHHPQLVLLDATISKVSSNKNSKTTSKKGIEGARFMDLKKEFSNQASSLPNTLPSAQQFEQAAQKLGINQDSVIVIYDELGIYSSPRAWWLFKAMGHQQVAVLDGGLPAWKKTGSILKSYQNPTTLGTFKSNFKAEIVVTVIQVVAALNDSNQMVLDARSEARFLGKETEPRVGLKSGHMPNAVNLPYTSVVQEGFFLPRSALESLFHTLASPKQTLIFTCGSGVTACIILLAADLLGYQNLQLYDGSWSEWGQLENVPIETS